MDNTKPDIINLYIGYDANESIAYHVLVQSIMERTSCPVRITPIIKDQIPEYQRLRTNMESTEFSMTRFLTPWLSDYEGWSLFMDCDFLFEADLAELWQMRDEKYSVMVCKHDYRPRQSVKFLDRIQTEYQKKNWSSLILFNNKKCRALTPDYVNEASGLDLHQFNWLEGMHEIGELPKNWNHLVGEENQELPAKGIHFTTGGPWFKESRNAEFSSNWMDYRSRALLADPYKNDHLLIDAIEYEVIPPRFKEKGRVADYFQLNRLDNEKKYHLKSAGFEHRGIQHRHAYIFMQALGSELAKYFNFSVQACEIVRLNGCDFLLTEDIRGQAHVKGMEPLSYYSQDVISSSRELNLLKEQLDLHTKEDTSKFLTKVILFDTLIGNSQRDARSLRIFEVDHSIFVENVQHRITTNHEFLIETNFGNVLFAPEQEQSLYLPEELIAFIDKHGTQADAKEFLDALSPKNVKKIIQSAYYLNSDQKQACLDIIDRQMDYLAPVEAYIYPDA